MTKKEKLQDELAALGVESFKSWTISRLEKTITTELKSIAATCKEIIATQEKYKSCYFWRAPSAGWARHGQEFQNGYAFTFEGNTYTVNQSLRVSCSNYYYSSTVRKNNKTTNITPIKTVLKKIEAITAN